MLDEKLVFVLACPDKKNLDLSLDILGALESIELYISNLQSAISDNGFLYIPTSLEKLCSLATRGAKKHFEENAEGLERNFDIVIAIPGWQKSPRSRKWVRKAIKREKTILCLNRPNDTNAIRDIIVRAKQVTTAPS